MYYASRFIPSIGFYELLIICNYLPKVLFFINKKNYFIGNNRDSYLVKALLDNYEEPLDISLISNNPFILSIGNNLNTPTNQNNQKQHLLPENTPNLPPKLSNKNPAKSKSIQELESLIDQKCNELALGSLKRDAETKQQISQELEAHYNTSLVKSLKDQIDILQSEVYFLREELREKIIYLRY